MLAAARGADLLLTIGGASVGDLDLVRRALGRIGFDLGFHKVAMRPGKPVIFGRLGELAVLGLPGNPVSAVVTLLLFAKPAIEAMLGVVRSESAVSRRHGSVATSPPTASGRTICGRPSRATRTATSSPLPSSSRTAPCNACSRPPIAWSCDRRAPLPPGPENA